VGLLCVSRIPLGYSFELELKPSKQDFSEEKKNASKSKIQISTFLVYPRFTADLFNKFIIVLE
jgi:hypothetical protein